MSCHNRFDILGRCAKKTFSCFSIWCIYQCVTRPKIWTRPVPRLFFGTKFFRDRFRDFFRYQFFSRPVPRLFSVPNFFDSGSDTIKKLKNSREREFPGPGCHTLRSTKCQKQCRFLACRKIKIILLPQNACLATSKLQIMDDNWHQPSTNVDYSL